MTLLQKIENNFAQKYNINNQDDLNILTHSTVILSLMIATYAHKDQFRRNGEPYILYPVRMMELYKDLIGIVEEPQNIDIDQMHKLNLPYEGVMELCLLHDVVEDTSITFDKIEQIFKEKGLNNYFSLYIKRQLILLTHAKGEAYDEYIKRISISREASLGTILDMYNNTNFLTVGKLDNVFLNKLQNYQKYIIILNAIHNFNDAFAKYNTYRKKQGRLQ